MGQPAGQGLGVVVVEVGFDGEIGGFAAEDGGDVGAVDLFGTGDGGDDAPGADPDVMVEVTVREPVAEEGVAGDDGQADLLPYRALGEEGADAPGIFGGDEEDGDLVFVLLLEAVEVREVCDAAAAAGRPEVDEQELAFVVGQL